MIQKKDLNGTCFTLFKESIDTLSFPERFNFPFYYTPNPLCLQASKELQIFLENQTSLDHNFGLNIDQKGLIIGKMFGVLVVQNKLGQLGYLSAFSGKLAGQNHHDKFVPPVFDILKEDGFFRKGEAIVNKINSKIEELERAKSLQVARQLLQEEKKIYLQQFTHQKQLIKEGKNSRKIQRNKAIENLNPEQYAAYLTQLSLESIQEQYALKDLSKYWKHRLSIAQGQLDIFLNEIALLKEERKQRSSSIQKEIFENYTFLNQRGEKKDLCEIFQNTLDTNPPAGAGECAAPKLLQYAFLNDLKPISIAEFWWGRSPDAEIRKHGNFYPACRGKCEPILAHMLQGIEVDENPMLTNPALEKQLETVYEDQYLVVINKPAEFLSVPGTNIQDSVYDRMKLKYPEAKGPLVVHRLDMSTSGLMLIAKTKEVHKSLQRQFLNRIVKKQYVALLEGELYQEEGSIELPLRVDLDNRPQQLVCHEHGKRAFTKWKLIEKKGNISRVHFFPITGRTHQLRVHSSHPRGLNIAILGDDLYGTKRDRLYLHAETIEFNHPVTLEKMKITCPANF